MIISKEREFIFAAFNKTGTQSMELALRTYRTDMTAAWLKVSRKDCYPKDVIFKHLAPRHIRRLVGEELWSRCFKFTFVRNPWSRTVSLYFYHRTKPEKFPLAQQSFEDWLWCGGTGSARKLMSDFVCDEHGNVILDFIGRFENLRSDFQVVCDRIGVRCELPHLNRTSHQDYRSYYTQETKDIVRNWAQKDIDMFGYEF